MQGLVAWIAGRRPFPSLILSLLKDEDGKGAAVRITCFYVVFPPTE
jgi:hypothetical protein